MIRFLATGMTALTLMGATAAFAPVTQVFAAETETVSDASEGFRELKTMSVKEADAYIKELVGDTDPIREYDNCKEYKIGNTTYSISIFQDN